MFSHHKRLADIFDDMLYKGILWKFILDVELYGHFFVTLILNEDQEILTI